MNASVLESQKSFPVFVVLDGKKKSRLDRALSVFADVRAGEGAGALLLATNALVLMASYYLLKVMRDTLILSARGPEAKAYTAAGMAFLLLFLVPAYGAFAARVVRVRLIAWVTLFFASHLAVFAALYNAGVRFEVAYYLWLGIFNFLLVGQFWAFANDIYDEHKGKRLFPMVGVGMTAGGLAGALFARLEFKNLGVARLLLLAGAGLVVNVVITLVVNRRESSKAGGVQQRIAREPIGGQGGFQLVMSNRYLLLIAVAILLLNMANSTGEFLKDRLADAQVANSAGAQRLQFFGTFTANFTLIQNVIALLLQLFVVSRIFRYFGVRTALFLTPLITLGTCGLALTLPALGAVMMVKALENATDYSLNNTARHALFLPTSREAKYKAKIAIDTFFARFGDMLVALLVWWGTQEAMNWGIRQYATVNVCVVVIWLMVIVALVREHKRLLPDVA